MKTRTTLFILLATGGLIAAMTACGSDNPIITPGGGGSNSAGGTPAASGTSTGATGTGASGGGSSPSGFRIDAGGYVIAGTWKGYAFTAGVTSKAAGAAATTIDPANFSSVAAGATELCATGSIGQATDYGGVAMIGVNVNQAQLGEGDAGPAVQEVAIGGTGITVTYTNPGNTEIRVQIQTIAGETNATGRWCAVLGGDGGTETLTWAQFWGGTSVTTDGCWNSAGNHPAVGTLISQVALLVPGGNAAAVPYSFCLQGVGQAG